MNQTHERQEGNPLSQEHHNPIRGMKQRIAPKHAKRLVQAVAESVGSRMGVSAEDILGRSRLRLIVNARHESIAEVHRARPHWSYPQIGLAFGLDHTTVLNALRNTGAYEPGSTDRARKARDAEIARKWDLAAPQDLRTWQNLGGGI